MYKHAYGYVTAQSRYKERLRRSASYNSYYCATKPVLFSTLSFNVTYFVTASKSRIFYQIERIRNLADSMTIDACLAQTIHITINYVYMYVFN